VAGAGGRGGGWHGSGVAGQRRYPIGAYGTCGSPRSSTGRVIVGRGWPRQHALHSAPRSCFGPLEGNAAANAGLARLWTRLRRTAAHRARSFRSRIIGATTRHKRRVSSCPTCCNPTRAPPAFESGFQRGCFLGSTRSWTGLSPQRRPSADPRPVELADQAPSGFRYMADGAFPWRDMAASLCMPAAVWANHHRVVITFENHHHVVIVAGNHHFLVIANARSPVQSLQAPWPITAFPSAILCRPRLAGREYRLEPFPSGKARSSPTRWTRGGSSSLSMRGMFI
jgi:hypothetical protein